MIKDGKAVCAVFKWLVHYYLYFAIYALHFVA